MGKFLFGEQLSKKIKTISKGGNKRYAVAFWGDGAFKVLFPDDSAKGAQVICDLSMGATNPAEIRKLQKNGVKVKHIESFHGKVYLSDKGVVVASANASHNGLGFKGEAKHVETGVFHKSGSKVHKQVKKWFGGIWDWEKSENVTAKALKDAQTAWESRNFFRNSAHPSTESLKGITLLEALRDYPNIFKDISFVITSEEMSDDDESEAKRSLSNDSFNLMGIANFQIQEIDREKYEDFVGFDLNREDWPHKFINIHFPKGCTPIIKLCSVGHVLPVRISEGQVKLYHLAYVEKVSSKLFSAISDLDIVSKKSIEQMKKTGVQSKMTSISISDGGPYSADKFRDKIKTLLAKL